MELSGRGGSDGANQPHWSFNNNIVPTTDTIEAVANIDQQHFNGGGVVVEGHYTKLSDLRKSSVHNNNNNINNVNKQTSAINNVGSVVDMLDVKQNNTTLELANPANNTPSQIGKPNAVLRTNSSFDYIGGGEQIQTHPHRDKPHGHHHGHSHDLSSVRAIAYTIIAGDGLHNFCDGIAIGAAFANDMRGGLSTSIAVLCHELPHELGDFAVLLHAGMSVKSALFYNLLSSILCAAGMIIGFLLGGMHSLDTWIFMLAAGMFIYIALVDMMPELSANQLKGNRRCHQPSVLFLWQNFGLDWIEKIYSLNTVLNKVFSHKPSNETVQNFHNNFKSNPPSVTCSHNISGSKASSVISPYNKFKSITSEVICSHKISKSPALCRYGISTSTSSGSSQMPTKSHVTCFR
ncbi:unnamed protein product [Schistosoma mattheei]|uniref:Uncharacterized protein n=1 Tax=Schistosoma mattheei TaxID=31246 RepID=A0A183P934_9TREM|nr:unnamed protein product [Schistosoma mattheei]